MMRALALLALVACSEADAQSIAAKAFPRGCRDRSCLRDRVTFSNEDPFVLVEDIPIRVASGSYPVCTGDAHCVALCRVTSVPDWQCFDNAGATIAGMNSGSGTDYVDTFAPGVKALNDVTDAKAPNIEVAGIRSLTSGDYTVIAAGYATTLTDPLEWWWMQTDGTNNFQARNESGSFRCLDSAVSGSGKLPVDGWQVVSCRRSGNSIFATSNGDYAGGAGTAAPYSAVSAGNPIRFGRGSGAGGNGGPLRGPLAWVAFYDEAKTVAWIKATEKAWYGAGSFLNQTNVTGAVTGLGVTGFELDGGFINVMGPGSYFVDQALGLSATKDFQNVWATDPLAAGTWTAVGTPTITSNAASGPFSRWHNTAECDLIVDDSAGAFEGVEAVSHARGVAGGDFYNASAYLKAGTSGTTTDKARIIFTNADGGSLDLDAGSGVCDITGLDSTVRRYPADDGCWIKTVDAVRAQLLVGNTSATTGSITVCQAQLTVGPNMERPTISGTAVGAGLGQVDAGSIPTGFHKGKVEVVFRIPYNTLTQMLTATETVHGSFIEDAWGDTGPAHVITQIIAGKIYAPNPQTDVLGLMYGDSQLTQNKFDVFPLDLLPRTFYVMATEWRVEGAGCRGVFRFDACSDPATCRATTIVKQNTGGVGECPSVPSVINLGQRYDGTEPTTAWISAVRIYR